MAIGSGLGLCLIAFLLFAAEALAARVSYSGTYNGNVLSGGKPATHPKLATMEDEKAEAILKNMFSWSGGVFDTKKHERSGIIRVFNVKPVESEAAAVEKVAEMQRIIMENYRAKSKSPEPEPEPGPAGQSSSGSKVHHRRWLYRTGELQRRQPNWEALEDIYDIWD